MNNDTIISVPFNTLTRAPENVRSQKSSPEKIEAIAASILAQGLLQNLVGYADGNGHNIVAGGSRLEAIGQLVERGEKPADWPVPVKVISKEEATAASLTENVARENMHPADEFDAFRKLNQEEGWSIDRIADAFGVTPLVVERRLRLIAAAPELIEEFRAGEISTDQLIALCASEDHERQRKTWEQAKGRGWMERPNDLRKAVLAEGEVDVSNDRRIGFIGGLDVYRNAGGEVRQDLFTGDGSGGFITDEALLDSLVADKLEAEAAKLRAEGWGWVDIWPEWDWQDYHRLGRAPTSDADMPEDARSKIEALQAEAEALEKKGEDLHGAAEAEDRELTDEEWKLDSEFDDRVREIEHEIEAITDEHSCFLPEVKANAGAIVALDRGQLRIERGMVKTADRKAVAAAAGDDSAVIGGRETESAGRKPDAVSDALRRSLIGHRNLAAQIEVAKRPDVAKVLLACWTIERIRNIDSYAYNEDPAPTDLSIGDRGYGSGRGQPITDEPGQQKGQSFLDEVKAVAKALPAAKGKLWDALAQMSAEELDKIIAYGVALSVSLSDEHKGLTGKLLDMLDFDMAEHFTPTAANYLGRVSKPLMVEALTEAKKIKGKDDETALLAMKKGQLAEEAETRLAGSGWVPKGIRTPKARKIAAKASTKKASAKKTAPSKPKAQPKRKASAPAEAQATA